MNKKEHITGDREWWVCICKNDLVSDGFTPCNEKGEEVEPVGGRHRLYVCDRCDRIIDSNTLEVVGMLASQPGVPELIVDVDEQCYPILGELYATPRAWKAIKDAGGTIPTFLKRHRRGDWGDCSDKDWKSNDEALRNGGRILAVYHTKKGDKLWVITERNSSATTFLLPEEY